MKRTTAIFFGLAPLLALGFVACGQGSSARSGGGPSGDGGSDADADADADADDDSDSASDGGTDGGETIAVGEVVDVSVYDGVAALAVALADADESFIAVIYSGAFTPAQELPYDLVVTGAGAATAKAARAASSAPRRDAPLIRLAPDVFVPPGLRWPDAPRPRFTPPPAVGERRQFQVLDATFTSRVDIEAECVFLGVDVAVWLDRTTAEPPTEVAEEVIVGIVAGLEDTALPRLTEVFGPLSDVDKDGLVHILFTSTLSDVAADSYVNLCDLGEGDDCPTDNNMEIIYTTPPNLLPNPMFQGVSARVGVMAHELQHLIYFAEKFVANGLDYGDDNPYVTESLSAMAEDLSGYGNGNFFMWATSLPLVMDLSAADIADTAARQYATDPILDAALRGMGYLFFRYLFDQMGGNAFGSGNVLGDQGGIAFLRDFESNALLGADGLAAATGHPAADLAFDWYTALVVSNRPGPDGGPLNTDPRFNYQGVTEDPDTVSSLGNAEKHGVDLFSASPMGAPLAGPAILDYSAADGIVRGGGADLLRIPGGPRGGTLSLRVAADPAIDLRVRLVRER